MALYYNKNTTLERICSHYGPVDMLTKNFFSLGVCSSRRICPFCHLFIIKLRKGGTGCKRIANLASFSKLYIPSTINTDFISWHLQLVQNCPADQSVPKTRFILVFYSTRNIYLWPFLSFVFQELVSIWMKFQETFFCIIKPKYFNNFSS